MVAKNEVRPVKPPIFIGYESISCEVLDLSRPSVNNSMRGNNKRFINYIYYFYLPLIPDLDAY